MVSVTRVARATVTPRPRPGTPTRCLPARSGRSLRRTRLGERAAGRDQGLARRSSGSGPQEPPRPGGRVGRRHDDRAINCGRHLPHDRFAERASLGGGADRYCRLHIGDDIGQRVPRPARAARPTPPARCLGGAAPGKSSNWGIPQSAGPGCPVPRFGEWLPPEEPFPHHLVAHHVRDTDSGGARTVNDHPLVAHRAAGGLTAANAAAITTAAVPCMSSLNVHLVGVLVQDAPSVAGPKSSQCSMAWEKASRRH